MNDSEAREILRANGETPPVRGKLNDNWRTLAEGYAQPSEPPAADSYEGGVTEADFPPDDEPAAEITEQKPRRVRNRPERSSGSAVTRLFAKDKPKRKHPRVPVDRFISRFWEIAGGLAGRVDVPLGRCLEMQAPVAGLILEDVVKGTAVDRALQPVVRAEEKAEKVLALAAPPMLVLALEASMALPPEQARVRQAIIAPMLEESLVLWVRVAGDKLDAQLERERELGPAREQAQKLMGLMFAQVPDDVTEEKAA